MNKTLNPAHGFENKRWSVAEQKIEYRHRIALELIPESTTSLLDVGCGEGTFLSLVHEKFPTITISGSDLSEVALSRVREKKLNITCTLVDANNLLPYEDKSFDIVSALDVLEHTLEPERILSEMVRVSKQYVLLGVPNFSSLPARIQTLKGVVPENNKSNKGHMYWFNYFVLQNLLKKNKLKIVKVISNHQLQNKPFLGKIIEMGKKVFPNLFSLSFVILVSRKND
jgi:methionine biosynthesis protein MetW